MNNVADLLKDNRCRLGERLQAYSGEKGLSVSKSAACVSPFLATRGMIGATERSFGAKMKHMHQSWRDRKSRGCESGVRWEGASGWVGGQGGSGADVSRAEDGRASRKDAVPSMPLLQPGAGRGKEENRDKIKLQASSAHSPAAAHAASKLTDRQSFSAQPYFGFELLRITILNNGADNSHKWSVFLFIFILLAVLGLSKLLSQWVTLLRSGCRNMWTK